ncbi:MAG: tRNA lysidine(34) synthetase TilS [Holosporaceae bacterium]|nr:tRNA lysidine(34) synthetase TilS [Holosporaceae bacterium]
MDKILNFCAEQYFGEDISENISEGVGVAVSGGSDSLSLLILATEWARKKNIPVFCITVDHQLRKESAVEADFVGNFCKSRGIGHTILHWHRKSNHIDASKLENLAREARYELLADFCENKGIKFLLVGHTWNDQLETFEIRKKFGSSESGLAGMSQIRSLTDHVKLLRPLLHFTKNELRIFLKNQEIIWCEDPMNHQEIFLRVAFRKEISTYDIEKLEDISAQIKGLGEKRNIVESAAVYFLKNFCIFFPDGSITLEINPLLAQKKDVQAEILRRVIWRVGGKKYATTIGEDVCDKIFKKRLNTIGRCLLKVKKESLEITKEKRPTYQTVSTFRNANLFDIFL